MSKQQGYYDGYMHKQAAPGLGAYILDMLANTGITEAAARSKALDTPIANARRQAAARKRGTLGEALRKYGPMKEPKRAPDAGRMLLEEHQRTPLWSQTARDQLFAPPEHRIKPRIGKPDVKQSDTYKEKLKARKEKPEPTIPKGK